MRRIAISLSILILTVTSAAAESDPVRFGVLSIAQPARVYAAWTPFSEYVSERLGRKVEIVVPRGFGKMSEAVENGSVDFFYVNSHVYYSLSKAGLAIGVAQMINLDGKPTSRSDVFVRADSGIDSLDQLRGRSVAFVSPMGAGGYLAPRAYFYSRGIKTNEEMDEVFSKNLSNSIYGVVLGDTAAGVMCGVNYRLMSEKIETGELVIIATTDDYAENLIAGRADLDPELRAQFARIVTNMGASGTGRDLLTNMRGSKILEFVPYDVSIETITETLLRQGQF